MTRPQQRRAVGLLAFLLGVLAILAVKPAALDNPLVGVAIGVAAAIVALSVVRVKDPKEVAGEMQRDLGNLPREQLADIVKKAMANHREEEKLPEAERERRHNQRLKELEKEVQKRR